MPADVAVPAPCANYSLRGTCAGVLWVGLMGVSFMGIFTAWICTQSFAVKLLNTGGLSLGSWLIGLVYLCFILSNQVAASVVGTVGAKWTMFVGSIGYFLCTAGVTTQIAWVTLAGGACVGLGGGLLWSGQGRMITDLSDDSTRGLCSGLFYCLMFGGSGVVGSVITLFFAPQHTTTADDHHSGSGSGSTNDSGLVDGFDHGVHVYFSMLCIPVGVGCAMLALMPNLPKPTEQLSLVARVQRTWSVLLGKKMLLMAPYCFHIGVSISFTTFFYREIKDNRSLAVIGIYNCVGGFLALPVGQLSDRIGRRPVAIFAMCLDLAAYHLATVSAKAQPIYDPKSLWHSVVICGPACYAGLFDGAAISLYQVLQAATISTLFADKDSEAAFAVRDTWISLSSIIGACFLTQLIPGPPPGADAAALQAASRSFDFVMALCAASLIISTSFYMAADGTWHKADDSDHGRTRLLTQPAPVSRSVQG